MLLLYKDILLFSACVDPIYIFLQLQHSIMNAILKKLLLRFLFIMNVILGFSKV